MGRNFDFGTWPAALVLPGWRAHRWHSFEKNWRIWLKSFLANVGVWLSRWMARSTHAFVWYCMVCRSIAGLNHIWVNSWSARTAWQQIDHNSGSCALRRFLALASLLVHLYICVYTIAIPGLSHSLFLSLLHNYYAVFSLSLNVYIFAWIHLQYVVHFFTDRWIHILRLADLAESDQELTKMRQVGSLTQPGGSE